MFVTENVCGGFRMKKQLKLEGVIPAIILPLNLDYSIDEQGFRRHIRRVSRVKGVTGIVCNAHASEVTLLSREERERVLEIVCEEVKGKVPVIAGAYGESTQAVIESAQDAREGGADAILIMPPFSFVWGATQYPEVVFKYFSDIDRAVDTPFVIFQYAYWTNCNYDSEILRKLAKIKNFIAIKNAVNDPRRYEEEYHTLKAIRPEISFLNANDVQLLSYFSIGSDGTLVGYACLAPELIVRLYEAVRRGNLKEAMEINDYMYPLTKAIYSHPRLYWHTRIKEALVMMGEIKCAAARPFLPPISSDERRSIRKALIRCGLLKK
jgi:4-hydroxy-tetrahydrodipicolinate synthase